MAFDQGLPCPAGEDRKPSSATQQAPQKIAVVTQHVWHNVGAVPIGSGRSKHNRTFGDVEPGAAQPVPDRTDAEITRLPTGLAMMKLMMQRRLDHVPSEPAEIPIDPGMVEIVDHDNQHADIDDRVRRHAQQRQWKNLEAALGERRGRMPPIRSEDIEFFGRMMKTMQRPKILRMIDAMRDIIKSRIQ